MSKLIPQSPTSLSTYLTCPRQYEAKYITKEVVFTPNKYAEFGDLVHKAIETYLKRGRELPPLLLPLKPLLDKIKTAPTYLAERKLGVDKEGNACDFFAASVYQRCIVDAIVANASGTEVICIDWKTGKKRDARTQHDFIRKCASAAYPSATITTAFIYLFHGTSDLQVYRGEVLVELNEDMSDLASAHATDTFPPNPSGLCGKWCDVLSCEHNGRK